MNIFKRHPKANGNDPQTNKSNPSSDIEMAQTTTPETAPHQHHFIDGFRTDEKGIRWNQAGHRVNDDGHRINEHGHKVNHNGHKITKGVHPEGESGRRGIHPIRFRRICFRSSSPASSMVNILWPTVPAAIAVRYARHDLTLATFVLSYLAMIPCANLIGFAGQELARKLPNVFGVFLETTLGSVVEIVLFMVLLKANAFKVVQDAILGSILATVLLCLGACFFAGGMHRDEQSFDEAVSEVGNGLLLTAGLGLVIPTAFYNSLSGNEEFNLSSAELSDHVLHISRITAILLIISYGIYVYFNMRSHHTIYESVFRAEELHDADRHIDLAKNKLTLTECIFALTIAIGLVSFLAVILVEEIPIIVEKRGISETFMGLILVPLVEKFAEHLTAVDEAWDNTMNLALSHILGSTVQTALFNAPLVVLAGWGLNKDMSLNFELFTIVILILSIIVVGNFLRDQKSNYLEGSLCIIVYVIIAAAAFYYPNPPHAAESGEPLGSAPAETTAGAAERMMMF